MSITTIKKLTSTPFIVDIPTSQWNGENGNFYITVNASNITVNSILVPSYDYNSVDLFAGTKLWCEPANGSFTINVDVKPTGTVTVLVQFMGVVGEANYQVLSDVYSKSQTYSKSEVYTKTETNSSISQSTEYAAGSAVPYTAFRGMGRVVNAGNAIFVYVILDRRITATSFTITCNGCYFFNSGATLVSVSTPQTITYSGNSGSIMGNTIAFTVPVTNSLTAQEIYLMEMFNTTIKFA